MDGNNAEPSQQELFLIKVRFLLLWLALAQPERQARAH
jgi:hypothetical protein